MDCLQFFFYVVLLFTKVLDTNLLFHKMVAIRNVGLSEIQNVNMQFLPPCLWI